MKQYIIGLFTIILSITGFFQIGYANPPSFESNFAEKMLSSDVGSDHGNESLRDRSTLGLDKNKNLMENIRNMFYPDSSGQGGRIRDIIKVFGVILFVGAIIWQGFNYILASDDENATKGYHINIAYIFLGGIIFFSATWILGIGLSLGGDGGTTEFFNKLDNSIIFQIFGGIRAGAFFTAIILLGYYGRSMIAAMDDEEKLKNMRQGVINVLIALIVIKFIDYIYFIAQSPDLKSRATELIVEISKVLGYILGGAFTLSIIYYGFRLMFSAGDDEALNKVKNIITAILLGTLVLFLFFLIIYQVVQEFAI